MAKPGRGGCSLATGARPEALLHSNPIARRDHFWPSAVTWGVRTFVVDSASEVVKVADAVPGATVLARI